MIFGIQYNNRIKRQQELDTLAKAKKMEAAREYVCIQMDNNTIKMIEKSKYEKLYCDRTDLTPVACDMKKNRIAGNV